MLVVVPDAWIERSGDAAKMQSSLLLEREAPRRVCRQHQRWGNRAYNRASFDSVPTPRQKQLLPTPSGTVVTPVPRRQRIVLLYQIQVRLITAAAWIATAM